MNNEKLRRLMREYFNNTINAHDLKVLLTYLEHTKDEELTGIDELLFQSDNGPEFPDHAAQRILLGIKNDASYRSANVPVKEKRPFVYFSRTWLQAAAILFILLTAGYYFLQTDKNIASPPTGKKTAFVPQIIPGSNKATLTLAAGKVINLNEAANGVIAQTGSGTIQKTKNGTLVYDRIGSSRTTPDLNVLTTPRGGEYAITLSDGTLVHLNSSSSLSYPDRFAGNERVVKLTGEAYFEVAKNKSKPFFVQINDVKVRVLGTHFNIKAYADDDNIATTLLEGSVRVIKNKSESLITPGQQAVVSSNSDQIRVTQANITQVMAWKNGYFKFDDDNIHEIMKQVSRWYDVDVEYQGDLNKQRFGGTFYRTKSITELLNYLEKLGNVHFKIVGRRIIVMA